MKVLNGLALTLIIIGALNWLLVGLFDFNLVDYIFGTSSMLAKTIYILVGVCGVLAFSFYGKIDKEYNA